MEINMHKVTHKNMIGFFFLAAMAGLSAGIVLFYAQMQSLLQINAQVIQSYQTIRAANRTTLAITDAALRLSIFLNTHEQAIIQKIPEIIISAKVNLSTLGQLIQDDQIQRKMFLELLPLFNKKINFLDNYVTQAMLKNKKTSLEPFSDKSRIVLTYRINELLEGIREQEINQLNSNNKAFLIGEKKLYKIFIFGSILLFCLFLFGFMALNNYFKKY
jgi:CHASE3 domain sensor protein